MCRVTTANPLDSQQGAEFIDVSLRGARFVRVDLSDVVMRAVEAGMVTINKTPQSKSSHFRRVRDALNGHEAP